MEGYIYIYDETGQPRVKVPVTKEAVHEEELMKSDLVRLSWLGEERFVLSAGWFIVPLPQVKAIDGTAARFTLLAPYQPERTAAGYRYEPEFQHPKMWLGYVPYVFTTQDASGTVVEKTEFPYVGQLATLLVDICDFINAAFGLATAGKMLPDMSAQEVAECTSFAVYPLGIDTTQTVSLSFKDMDVLSAIAEVAKVCECEWHIDWDARFLYFGKVRLGVSEYPLVVEGNVGVPSVTRSGDGYYNAYLVHGSSRNNTRSTENGNIAVDAPLTLAWERDGEGNVTFRGLEDEEGNEKYPASIIDMRGTDGEGRRTAPRLTEIITVDDVYPRYELYLYDIVERKRYKRDENDHLTAERYSVWYTRLARKVSDGVYEDFPLTEYAFGRVTGRSWRWYDPSSGQTIVSSSTSADIADRPNATAVFEYTDDALFTTLPYYGALFRTEIAKVSGMPVEVVYTTVHAGGKDYGHIGVMQRNEEGRLLTTLCAAMNHEEAFSGLLAAVAVGDELAFPDMDVDLMPSANKRTYAVDGLVPTLAFQINDNAGAVPSSLGTREFELIYHSKEVTFGDDDDVEGAPLASLRIDNIDAERKELELELKNDDIYFLHATAHDVTLLYNGVEYDHVTIYGGNGGYMTLTLNDQGIQHPEWLDGLAVGDRLTFSYGFDTKQLPKANVVGAKGYRGYTLGAGYYEIIHTEEGSDKLVMPTTMEQAIIPRQYTDAIDADIERNNKATIFNIVMDDATKLTAQGELEGKALALIAERMADVNNYTFKGNPVDFEGENPNLFIGRRVHFTADGLDLHTRILKLTTHLDYAFDQEVTVGNTIVKGQVARLRDELSALQDQYDSWVAGGTGETTDISSLEAVVVYRGAWDGGEYYYYESYNRATGKVETSEVTHYGGARWQCRRNLTAQEPAPGCTDWVMTTPPLLQYVEYPSWDSSASYYCATLNAETDVLETSRVWHYDALWECLRSLTAEEPTLGAEDWRLLRAPIISLPFYDGGGLPLLVLPVHSDGVIEEDVVPRLMFGQYDFSERVASWQWERESVNADLDAMWGAEPRTRQQRLTLTNADFPAAWWTGTLSFRCTATFDGTQGGDATEITNVITT